MWYAFFKYGFVRPWSKLLFQPTITGEENIPPQGAIMAANHIGTGETFLLPALITRPMVFPAKAELFLGKGSLKAKAVAWFLKAVGQVPMDRSGGRASAAGLTPINEVLRDGGLVGIFPEGSRSPDGNLYKGKTGVARMALENDVPVVPVGMRDTGFTKGPLGITTIWRPHITIGAPLRFSELAGRQGELKVLRQVTDEVMAAIQQLTGQTYVDVYSTRVKFGDLKGADLTPHMLEHPGAARPQAESPGDDRPADGGQ
ncbi:lysophospholipid acyltransferase family protein [Aestuariimicrobium ganziense]|uniref:lysophospholipid acyltransferase family protein n=1 Tax=Aestuariimicrobium ganziense TaxID=2773677 RepID=UPI002E28DC8B|nr:lysophospholipid acyltransferase family protein [Aestuariimicrobium ganziense]